MELSAVIGMVQLKKVNKLIKVRRNNAKIFEKIIHSMPYLKSQKETGESSWFSFSIIVHEDANITRHFLVKSL